MTMLADSTVHVARAATGFSVLEIVALVAALIGIVTSILGVGVLWGRHSEFKEVTNDRITKLETSDSHAITREELDARFAEMRALIHALSERFGDLARHLSQPHHPTR